MHPARLLTAFLPALLLAWVCMLAGAARSPLNQLRGLQPGQAGITAASHQFARSRDTIDAHRRGNSGAARPWPGVTHSGAAGDGWADVVTELHSLRLASDVRTLRSLTATREDPTDAEASDLIQRPEADTVSNADTAADFSTTDSGGSGGATTGDDSSQGADSGGTDTGSPDSDSESQETGSSNSEGTQGGRSDTSTGTSSGTGQQSSGDENSSEDSDAASAEGQGTHTSSSADSQEVQGTSGNAAEHDSSSAKDGRDSSGSSVSGDDNDGDGMDGVDRNGNGRNREESSGSRDNGRQSHSGSTLRERLTADGYDPDTVTAGSGDEDSGRDAEASGVGE